MSTCWVLNDDIYGTLFSTCLGLGLTVLRNLDSRLIQAQGQSRKVLLEDLCSQKPDLLLGVLKAPATHVGTKLERQFCETLFALCGEQLRCKQSILFVGPRTNRYMDSLGLKYLLQHKHLHHSCANWCCLGVRAENNIPFDNAHSILCFEVSVLQQVPGEDEGVGQGQTHCCCLSEIH